MMEPESGTHYFKADVMALVATSPYLQLLRRDGWARVVSKAVAAGRAYAQALASYPEIRCEPLDFHYVCLQSLAPFDARLLQDMLAAATFRGVAWACTLAALEPKPEFGPILARMRPAVDSRQQWAIDLALARVHATHAPAPGAEVEMAARLSMQLAPLPRPKVMLRPAPGLEEQRAWNAQRDELRRRLKAQGVAGARAYYSGSTLEYFGMSLRRWNLAHAADRQAGR